MRLGMQYIHTRNKSENLQVVRCGHCKKLAPTWTQIASHFRNKLNIAEVNCEAHKSICKSQDVQGYPSLFLYTGGKDDIHKTEYVGGRKFDQIRQFAESAIAP